MVSEGALSLKKKYNCINTNTCVVRTNNRIVQQVTKDECETLLIGIQLKTFFYFFFQAEDGIRYRDVTGVQTCALPISSAKKTAWTGGRSSLNAENRTG